MICSAVQLFSRPAPLARFGLGAALLTVPRSLGGVVGKILFPSDISAVLSRLDARIIDLTAEGRDLLEELKERISLDKEVLIAECSNPAGKDRSKHLICGGKAVDTACIVMDGDEIHKTFVSQQIDHLPHKLKLLLRLVQIKHHRRFGRAEQLYCMVALMSIAASRFSQLRFAWLWGLGAGQWAGNYCAGRLARQMQERDQIAACRVLNRAELARCIGLAQNYIARLDDDEGSLLLRPFDKWMESEFSHWQIAQLEKRAHVELLAQLSNNKSSLPDVNGDKSSGEKIDLSSKSFVGPIAQSDEEMGEKPPIQMPVEELKMPQCGRIASGVSDFDSPSTTESLDSQFSFEEIALSDSHTSHVGI